MSSTLREMQVKLVAPLRLSIWAGTTVVCGLSGPYESLEVFGQIGCFVFWGMSVAVAIVIAVFFDVILRRNLPNLILSRRAFVLGAMFSTVYAAFMRLVVIGFYPEDFAERAPFWALFLHILVITTLILLVIEHFRPQYDALDAKDPRLFKRLAPELGRDLLRVSSQNHHVEVQTKTGKDMILMRFSDALDELDGLDGARVHRSHWVSAGAIQTVDRQDGKITLRLTDGTSIPVSRGYRHAAERAGLI